MQLNSGERCGIWPTRFGNKRDGGKSARAFLGHRARLHVTSTNRGVVLVAGVTKGNLVVNWFRVIVDLTNEGWTHASIASAVGSAKTTVFGWKQGAMPPWEQGDHLIFLWERTTGKGREELPMVSPFDWRQ